ncbi:MAG: hypothetical protein RBT67_16380 [Thauera sp.]|jgi:hypothetical protein|nr:hypothetical protein [Thauera sp.]
MTKAELFLAECRRRGLIVTRVGKAWHIHGNGVDILASDLSFVTIEELNAARWCVSSAVRK